MLLRNHSANEVASIVGLFESVFSDSAGSAEGMLIGELASQLLAATEPRDLFNFVAVDDDRTVGSIFLTRLFFESDANVFVLGPVAVSTDRQKQGIGQSLIRHGINELKQEGIDLVLTYGDPAYYTKVGFVPIAEERVRAPFPLSQPHGWLGLSLTDCPIEKFEGHCTCVAALNDARYW